MSDRHPLLERQIAHCFDSGVPTAGVSLQQFGELVRLVDDAYRASDEDRQMLERSMEISSRELLQVNSELRAVLSSFPDLFLWVNEQGRIVETKVGDTDDPFLSRQDLVGQLISTLPNEDIGARLYDAMERSRREGTSSGFEYDLEGESGKYAHDVRLFPLENGQTFMIVRNVTDTRRVELAEAANRAKGDFLANMSHELRTPLHGILSFARFGHKKTVDQPELAKLFKYFSVIEESGETLLQLVDELLDVAKLDAGMMRFEFETMNLSSVLSKEVDHFVSRVTERGLSVDLVAPEEELILEGDAHRIAQVVRNLLSNAVKFSPRDGRIRVESSRCEGKARVIVEDEGPGIPDGEVEEVFKKFVQSTRTNSGAGGTGLGLNICRQIVEAHKGRVWAENGEGGARFYVELPLVDSGSERQAA